MVATRKTKKSYILEHECSFVIYVIEGTGKVFVEDNLLKVKAGDCVLVPKENKFAVEGKLEYVTVDTPAFYVEQSEEITVK